MNASNRMFEITGARESIHGTMILQGQRFRNKLRLIKENDRELERTRNDEAKDVIKEGLKLYKMLL